MYFYLFIFSKFIFQLKMRISLCENENQWFDFVVTIQQRIWEIEFRLPTNPLIDGSVKFWFYCRFEEGSKVDGLERYLILFKHDLFDFF